VTAIEGDIGLEEVRLSTYNEESILIADIEYMIDALHIEYDESIVTPTVTFATVTPTISIISATTITSNATSNRKRKRNQMPNLQIRTDLMQKY